ncbi:MAG: hypothetical protein ACI9NY_000496 [Kiritimatiellia bacterium]|jgi:hypothetical protein
MDSIKRFFVFFCMSFCGLVYSADPVINGVALKDAMVGDIYTYDLQASDTDGGELSYSLQVWPAAPGLSISPQGVVSWAPTDRDLAGRYFVTARVKDAEFNIVNQQYQLTLTDPTNQVPVISGSPSTVFSIGQNYAFDLQAIDINGDDLTYYVQTWPNAPGLSVSAQGLLTWEPIDRNVAGRYWINVQVRDGNLGTASVKYQLTVEDDSNQVPVINGSPEIEFAVGQAYSFDLQASDADGDSLTYHLQTWPSAPGLSVSDQGVVTWLPTDSNLVGSYWITAQVKDGQLGVASQRYKLTVTNPSNQAPEINGASLSEFALGQAYTFDVQASDADGDSLTYHLQTWPSAPGLSVSDQGVVTWLPTDRDLVGHYWVTVTAKDGQLGVASQRYKLTVTNPSNQAPEINGVPSSEFSLGQAYTFDVQASDADGDSLTYRLQTWPSAPGLSVSSQGVVAWLPTDKNLVGHYWITVQVRDGQLGVASQRYKLTVTNPSNQAPEINGVSSSEFAIGTSYSFDLQASDVDGDSLSYYLQTWPSAPGLSVSDQGVVTWLPTDRDLVGHYWVTVTAKDGQLGVASQRYKLTVTNPSNQAPEINGISSSEFTIGTSYFFDLQASDADGDSLTYHLQTWPSAPGLSVSDQGVVTWLPTDSNLVGNYWITAQVKDGQLGVASQRYQLTVSALNTPPTADAGIDRIVEETTAVELNGSNSFDPEGSTLTYHWDQVGGTSITLSNADTSIAEFIAPDVVIDEMLTFELTVSDGVNNPMTDSISISVPAATTCINTAEDSQLVGGVTTRINSIYVGSPTYHEINVRKKVSGGDVFIDYMVHEATGTAKALLLLIGGGQLNSAIEGSGGVPTNAGSNFLVRSAHLFAHQGYRVVTIDRPSDFNDDLAGSPYGSTYDVYRTSMRHAVDISTIISAVNQSDNLPVFLSGTSRGAISAVALHKLAAAIGLSASLTDGSFGSPITPANYDYANLVDNIHVAWNEADQCNVSTPIGSENLTSDLKIAGILAVGRKIAGGFYDPNEHSLCQARTVHGFYGIESCTVTTMTSWYSGLIDNTVPVTRPIAPAFITATSVPLSVDLSLLATGQGTLSFNLPFTTSSLGGVLSIEGSNVIYTPPEGIIVNTTDSFVYIVTDENGGTSHNVIKVNL